MGGHRGARLGAALLQGKSGLGEVRCLATRNRIILSELKAQRCGSFLVGYLCFVGGHYCN